MSSTLPTQAAGSRQARFLTGLARWASAGAVVYVGAVLLSVVAAHVLHVAAPHSGLAERLLRPLGTGLEFLDKHWKASLLLAAPFLAPLLRDLAPRLRKVGSVEFDAPTELASAGKREKPTPKRSGADR